MVTNLLLLTAGFFGGFLTCALIVIAWADDIWPSVHADDRDEGV